MPLIVQKFGGTSVADLERIRNVAKIVQREISQGNQVAVVVSAMAGTTNRLDKWARDFSNNIQNNTHSLPNKNINAEYDSIVAAGEQVSSGLLALALMEMGIPARSWQGWQVKVNTEGMHKKARIDNIDADNILADITQNNQVAVVAGFQGVTSENRIATLGRGGSDTSAVALAAALGAHRCDIYTDVDGVYTCDPRIVPKARKLHKISYEEMLELASLGAKVLQVRSVEMAMRHNVRLEVRSTFSPERGTLLVPEREIGETIMEKQSVTGIAYSRDEASITIIGVANKPGIVAAIFQPLAEAGINVDMIVQNITENGERTDVTFTVPRADMSQALAVIDDHKTELDYQKLSYNDEVAKISAVGIGMRSHAGVAGKMFDALAAKGINILVISTSEIKISVLIEESYTELAARTLHSAFDLDE